MKINEILAGISMGALVGVVIGLSATEVTGIILGALTSLLVSFFGLKPKSGNGNGNLLIISSFCISCAMCVLIGLYMRVNNVLSQSIDSDLGFYKKAGFTTEEIKDVILLTRFGIVPNTYSVVSEVQSNLDKTVLMNGKVNELYLCNLNGTDDSLKDILEMYEGSGSKYNKLAILLEKEIKDTNKLKESLITISEVICQK